MKTNTQVDAERYYYMFEEVEASESLGNPFDKQPLTATDALVPEPIFQSFNAKKKIGFWRRQFQEEITPKQRTFDKWYGVILPLVCFLFDPFVFRSLLDGRDFAERSRGILGEYQVPAYILAFAAIMANLAWTFWGPKLGWANAFISGILAVCSLASLAIGIVLFPFSLFGIVALFIGLLGFTPLFSSFVYLRNSVRAFRSARPTLEGHVLANSFGIAAIYTLTIPYVLYLLTR